jgi:hypothetical protein
LIPADKKYHFAAAFTRRGYSVNIISNFPLNMFDGAGHDPGQARHINREKTAPLNGMARNRDRRKRRSADSKPPVILYSFVDLYIRPLHPPTARTVIGNHNHKG